MKAAIMAMTVTAKAFLVFKCLSIISTISLPDIVSKNASVSDSNVPHSLRKLTDVKSLAGDEGFDLTGKENYFCQSHPSGVRRSESTGLGRSNPTSPGIEKAPICRWQMNALSMAGDEGFDW